MKVLIIVLISASFLSGKLLAEPYGPARQRAWERSKDSKKLLERSFIEVRRDIRSRGITGEKEHDSYTFEMLDKTFKNWKSLAVSKCTLETQIEVYPAGSMLYGQVYSNCMARENNKITKYLLTIKNSYQSVLDN